MKKLLLFLIILLVLVYFFQNELKNFLKEKLIILKTKYINPTIEKIKKEWEKIKYQMKKSFENYKTTVFKKIIIKIDQILKEWQVKIENFLKEKIKDFLKPQDK